MFPADGILGINNQQMKLMQSYRRRHHRQHIFLLSLSQTVYPIMKFERLKESENDPLAGKNSHVNVMEIRKKEQKKS